LSPDISALECFREAIKLDLKWSHSEKVIAKRAFESARLRELDGVIRQAKQKANRVSDPDQLWRLERWLTERREDINETYDFRYSVLPVVFAKLIYRQTLSEDELEGLGSEKIEEIRRGLRYLNL
jgi:hypothetical protein